MGNKVAPEGQIYVCAACGKTSRDRYGMTKERSYGWDSSCMLNCVLAKVDCLVFSNTDERLLNKTPFNQGKVLQILEGGLVKEP